MNYVVSLGSEVNFDPETEVVEILQNVRTIIGTRKGTVPLDRDFGISWDYVDQPIAVAQMLMRSEIVDAVETYEPRAKVESVTFHGSQEDSLDGVLKPIVTVSIGE
jgi:phage baseplate assembly protein W